MRRPGAFRSPAIGEVLGVVGRYLVARSSAARQACHRHVELRKTKVHSEIIVLLHGIASFGKCGSRRMLLASGQLDFFLDAARLG